MLFLNAIFQQTESHNLITWRGEAKLYSIKNQLSVCKVLYMQEMGEEEKKTPKDLLSTFW